MSLSPLQPPFSRGFFHYWKCEQKAEAACSTEGILTEQPDFIKPPTDQLCENFLRYLSLLGKFLSKKINFYLWYPVTKINSVEKLSILS